MGNIPSLWFLMFATSLAFLAVVFFRAAQLGIQRSTIGGLRSRSNSNSRSYRYARLVRIQAGKFLFVCQSGFFFSSVLLGFVGSLLTIALLPDAFGDELAISMATTLTLLAAGSLALVFVQILRSVAFSFPEPTLLFLSPLLVRVAWILGPVFNLIETIGEGSAETLGLSYPCERRISVPSDEIREIVDAGVGDGEIEQEERDMIKGIVLLSDTVIREVMTPRSDIVAISFDSTLSELRALIAKEQLSRILVIGSSLDDVRGVVHVKDLVTTTGQAEDQVLVTQIMRKVTTISGDAMIDDVLREFRNRAVHFAVVIDEHGGVDGVVTVEDLIEEIVGEIFDEFDSPADEVLVKKSPQGDLIVDGSMPFDDFNARFHSHLPTGEYETVAGFVLHQLSRFPELGEVLEVGRLRIRVDEIESNRIKQLSVLKRRRPFRLSDQPRPEGESENSSVESKDKGPSLSRKVGYG